MMRETSPAGDVWAQVLQPRAMRFPQDHGPHSDYRIEWWYYTGNLETESGHRFGYQLTFFRTGLQRSPVNPSRWTVRDLFTAHLAFADVTNRRFQRFERTNRAGVGWAGADGEAGRIWNGDWELRFSGETQQLQARQGEFALQLTLGPGKGPILHGDLGLSQKGAQPGNASYYYSFPRMPTAGTLTLENKTYSVRGQSWMDHEFSSSFLEAGQAGWDWFSIQLDNQHELMLYQIRGPQGRPDARSSGTWVRADGATEKLSVREFDLTPDAPWTSAATGARYPQEWRVRIPKLDAELIVKATFPNQEMDTRASTGIAYWEGSIDVSGSMRGQPATGRGYLEMTGYSDRPLGGLIE